MAVKRLWARYACAGVLAAFPWSAGAQLYPAKPVRLMVPFVAGGNTDIIARIVAPEMMRTLGQQIVIENRGGAGSMIGTEIVAKCSAAAQEVPTMVESGIPGFVVSSGFGLLAPAGTPRPVIDRVHGALVKAINEPAVRASLSGQGADPVGNTPEAYDAFNKTEIAKCIKVAREAGIQPE